MTLWGHLFQGRTNKIINPCFKRTDKLSIYKILKKTYWRNWSLDTSHHHSNTHSASYIHHWPPNPTMPSRMTWFSFSLVVGNYMSPFLQHVTERAYFLSSSLVLSPAPLLFHHNKVITSPHTWDTRTAKALRESERKECSRQMKPHWFTSLLSTPEHLCTYSPVLSLKPRIITQDASVHICVCVHVWL